MKKLYKNFFFLFLFLSALGANAQQTGFFTDNISFTNAYVTNMARHLSYYVPTNYNPANKYRLFVCLHGKGDNAANYISFNAQQIVTAVGDGKVILVAPDEGTYLSSFLDQEDVYMLDTAVIHTMKKYNIDPARVYLSGFSLGGRVALSDGLYPYYYKQFRGLMLFAPGVQSLQEADNSSFKMYYYENGKTLPVCMVVGDQDGFYTSGILTEVHNQFQANGAGSKEVLKIVPGMNHALPPQSYYNSCFQHIESFSVTAMYELDAERTSFGIFPNPSDGNFTIKTLLENTEDGSVNIYNVFGEKVLSANHIHLTEGRMEFHMEDQPAGIYFVELRTRDGVVTKKLILQK